jgi:hypothetical protein
MAELEGEEEETSRSQDQTAEKKAHMYHPYVI